MSLDKEILQLYVSYVTTPLASSTQTSSITDSDQFHSTTSIHSSDLESDDSKVTVKGFTAAQTKAQRKAERKKKSDVPFEKSLK